TAPPLLPYPTLFRSRPVGNKRFLGATRPRRATQPRTRQPDQATRQHQPGVRHQLGPCPSQHEAARGVLEALDYSHLNVLVTTPLALTAHAANTMIRRQPPGSPPTTSPTPAPTAPARSSARPGRTAAG